MALNARCKSRLRKFKFDSAQQYLSDSDSSWHESETIEALDETFGDSGVFQGAMAEIIDAVVSMLLEGWPDDTTAADPVEQWRIDLCDAEFASALESAKGDPAVSHNEMRVVNALADLFGNCGGLHGNMARIVDAAVQRLVLGWPDHA